ncbi:molecular chaperone DnaJ [Candidatus Uhrbacteria bacterium]|nr:molecular chaperone DnaJ [Candidatus Uhrbacteria bacterium]
MAKDYYKTLGLEKNALPEEIKKAFRKLAHEYHPDKTGGDDSKFKEALEAYQVLSNVEKRQQYDRFGATFEQAQAGAGGFGGFSNFGNFDFGSFTADFPDLSDVLGSLFGFGGSRSRRRSQPRGNDLQKDLTLTFEESVFGATKTIELYRQVACERCAGSGAEPGAKSVSCSTCGGRGEVRASQRTVFGVIQMQQTCDLCHGAGKKPEKVCLRCHGGGVSRELRKLEIKIPAGAEDGGLIRLSGEGEAAAHGGATGDLFLRLRVVPDRRFRRQGFEIFSAMPVPFTIAALGGQVQVETVDGPVELKIPAGVESGAVFRLRGKGVPRADRGGRGDHLVEVNVAVPKKLSRKQRRLLEEFEEGQ